MYDVQSTSIKPSTHHQQIYNIINKDYTLSDKIEKCVNLENSYTYDKIRNKIKISKFYSWVKSNYDAEH